MTDEHEQNEQGEKIITPVNRWETACCGYAFNTAIPGDMPFQDEPMTISVKGEGTFIAGECPGCGHESAAIEKIAGEGEYE